MIIRPICSREWLALPNAIFNDQQLSIDTRGMVAHILSKPKNWDIRPVPLAKALSRKGATPVGRKRLNRMFREAMDAGYMARSAEQTHEEDGSWGRYVYVVGMPNDVAAAVANSGVAFSPQSPQAHALKARAPEERANHKLQTQKSKIEKNSPLQRFSPGEPGRLQACQDEYSDISDMGNAAQAQGCKFVFEGSKPYNAWIEHRRAEGLPPSPLDEVTINGKRRRGAWLPQLYPPRCSNWERTT